MLSIIIPCRHESEATVNETVEGIRAALGEYPHEFIIQHDDGEPHGFGLAVRRGIERCTGEFVAIMMADGSDDPNALRAMVWDTCLYYGCDLVVASRYMQGGAQIGGPLIKRTLSRLAGTVLYPWLEIHDVTNAYKVARTKKLRELNLKSNGFALNLEITAKAHRAGLRIGEVPVTWVDRRSGRSKFKLRKELPQYVRWFLYALG